MEWLTYHTKNIKKKYLFKFLSEDHTAKFLNTGDLWFSRADVFGDKMECVRLSDLEKSPIDHNEIDKRKKSTLISCWHLEDKETLALWDTYSKTKRDRRVCAIRFKLSDLNQLIELSRPKLSDTDIKRNVYGKIVYKDLSASANLKKKSVIYSAFRKERAFKYESEYRFVIQLNSQYKDEGLIYSLGNPTRLPFHILINPLISSEEYKRLKNRFESGDHSSKVKESHLVDWVKPAEW
jgi:hypothetical protein